MTGLDTGGVTLILGGARSGKSRLGERLAGAGPAVYLATADPARSAADPEMAARIRHHRERRSDNWLTVEEPLELAAALIAHDQAGRPILVDCLTLWLGNVLEAGRDCAAARERLIAALEERAAPVILISNEVGLGLVPDTPLGRAFRDEAGRLNQAVAATADRVLFVAAGLPLALKGTTADLT